MHANGEESSTFAANSNQIPSNEIPVVNIISILDWFA